MPKIQLTYKFRLYPKKGREERLFETCYAGNMTRSHNLAQKILDASWGRFLQLLEFKAERAGALVEGEPKKAHQKG